MKLRQGVRPVKARAPAVPGIDPESRLLPGYDQKRLPHLWSMVSFSELVSPSFQVEWELKNIKHCRKRDDPVPVTSNPYILTLLPTFFHAGFLPSLFFRS
jgi:hypothetical protein